MSVGIDEERNLESEQIKWTFEPKEHEKNWRNEHYQNLIKYRTALMGEPSADLTQDTNGLSHGPIYTLHFFLIV